MLAIEAWGAKRFKPVAALAQVVVASAKECHEVVVASRGPWFMSGATQPNAWLRLYRTPLRVEDAIWYALAPPETAHAEGGVSFARSMRQATNAVLRQVVDESLVHGITPEEREWSQNRIERYYRRLHLPLMRRMLMEEEGPALASEWPCRQELVFFLAVAMPCWLEYKTTPWELFFRARLGDFVALENLIRLDGEADKEETLRASRYSTAAQNPAQYELLKKARQKGRKNSITLKQIKYSLGGLLMKWSKELDDFARGELLFRTLEARVGNEHRRQLRKWIKAEREARERTAPRCWLKAPDIVGLFNAIAQDTDQGLIDSDFAGYPNTIYKQLARNAKPWPALWEADKIRAA